MTDSVRQAIVRIACKSLASSGSDVQSEIDKLKAANLLPCDFQVSGSQKSLNNNREENGLKTCAARLVESIICKVKQQLACEQDAVDADQSQIDDSEFVKSVGANSRCCLQPRPHSTNNDDGDDAECSDARQQVLQCSLALLDQQTDAIVRDVEKVRQQVAVRMMSEVASDRTSNSGIQPSSGTASPSISGTTAVRSSRLSNRASTVAKRENKSASRSGSMGSASVPSKRVSVANEKAKKGKQRNSRKESDKNISSNAVIVESSDSDSDEEKDFEGTEDEESGSSDDSDEEWSGDEQQQNNSAKTKTSRCRLPLNRNCNAATGSEYGCGGCGSCGSNRVASCNVQDVLDRETLCRALEACDNGKMPVSEAELRKFAREVVESLYTAVRAKLSTMLDAEYAEAGGQWAFPKDELLAKADEEVRSQVLPVVVDHIVWLMKEERRALGQLDCDMMMIAFAGQFVDTIVTNAVLKTQVDLSGKRAYTRTFVATSNGGTTSGSGNGSGGGSGTKSGSGGGTGTTGVSSGAIGSSAARVSRVGSGSGKGSKSILRMPSQKLADDEEIQTVWTRSSGTLAQFAALGDENVGDENASNNCNNVAALSSTPARTIAGTSSKVSDGRSQTSQRHYRRRTDSKPEYANNHFYKANDCGINNGNNNNNNDNNGGDSDDKWNTAEGIYSPGNAAFICEKNGPYSTPGVFLSGYWLSENAFCYCTYHDCKQNSWNNNNYASNYNSNNNCADDDRSEDAAAAAAVDDHSRCPEDVQSHDDSIGDGFINHAVKNNSDIESDKITQERTSSDDEGVGARNTAINEQLAAFQDGGADIVDEELNRYLSTTVNHLLSVLGSWYLAHHALDSAAEWLSRYRASIDSRPIFHRRCRRVRQQQAYVLAGRGLLDRVPLGPECLSTLDRAGRRLFRRSIDGAINAVHDIRHNPTHDLEDAQALLIARTRSLWHQAIKTSELLLMKTAIQANFYDFHTPVRLSYCSWQTGSQTMF